MASGCKGRQAQKLHDFLKYVFREEGRVHVVQEDDEWEESEEAWELGEAETMIVGTVQQETGCSWQDACDAWAVQDEEMEAGVHQVEVSGTVGGPVRKDQCKKVDKVKNGDEQPERGGLLVEGEEKEYFLELLMRKTPSSQPTDTSLPKVEASTLKGKKKRNLGKKLRKKLKLSKGANHKEPRRGARQIRSEAERDKWPPISPTTQRSRVWAWPVEVGRREARRQHRHRPREGSVPDNKSRNIPEVVLVRPWAGGVLGIWRGGVGWVKGGRMGSVYKQPETEVDNSCHSWRVPSK
jgi:hypothetical protein